MGNCLVTKLKEVVNNDNLLKLGRIRFYVTPTVDTTYGKMFAVMNKESMYIDAIQGTIYDYDGAVLETPGMLSPRFGSYRQLSVDYGQTTIIELEKYKLSGLWCPGILIDIDELLYSPLEEVYNVGLTGNIEKFILSHLNVVTFNVRGAASSNISGSLSVVAQFENILDLGLFGDGIVGNISTLGTLTSCKEMRILDSQNVSGTLENLISTLSSNGASGTFVFNFTGTNVTYNGEPMTEDVSISI